MIMASLKDAAGSTAVFILTGDGSIPVWGPVEMETPCK